MNAPVRPTLPTREKPNVDWQRDEDGKLTPATCYTGMVLFNFPTS